MASSDPKKILWRTLQRFQNWAASDEPIAKEKFKLLTSFEDSEIPCPSDSSINRNTPHSFVSIIGLIYPSRELFGQRGLKIDIRVPVAYPDKPPRVFMCTCVRHPNVEKDGEICSSQLIQGRSWNKAPLEDVVKLIINLMEKYEKGHVVDAEMHSLHDTDLPSYKQKIMEAVNIYAERQIDAQV